MASEDPVADFLAREQNDLAGLDDEFGDAAAPVLSSMPTVAEPVLSNDDDMFCTFSSLFL